MKPLDTTGTHLFKTSLKTKYNSKTLLKIFPIFHDVTLSVSGVNLLLAIVLFSTIVGEMLPVTNNTPLIGQNTIKNYYLYAKT